MPVVAVAALIASIVALVAAAFSAWYALLNEERPQDPQDRAWPTPFGRTQRSTSRATGTALTWQPVTRPADPSSLEPRGESGRSRPRQLTPAAPPSGSGRLGVLAVPGTTGTL